MTRPVVRISPVSLLVLLLWLPFQVLAGPQILPTEVFQKGKVVTKRIEDPFERRRL